MSTHDQHSGAHGKERDELSGVETTGHEWDGIKELNNPLPRWWLWTFYGCIVWAIGYTVLYPAWQLAPAPRRNRHNAQAAAGLIDVPSTMARPICRASHLA